jgi:hypothetical protein
MRLLRSRIAIILTFALLLMGILPSAGVVLAGGGALALSGLQDVSYSKGDVPVPLSPGIVVENGGAFSGGFVKFSIANGSAGETLSLTKESVASVDSGKVSIVGSTVYLGDGTAATQIGVVNPTLNGEGGKALQIDFSTPLTNGDFESTGTVPGMPGWTVNNNVVVLDTTLATKTQGNTLTSSGSGPYTIKGPGNSYTYQSNKSYTLEGKQRAIDSTRASSFTSEIVTESGNRVLKLKSTGYVVTGTGAYGSLFGPEAISETFTASAGDSLAFDWRAQKDSGGDDYEIYGFLINTDTNVATELLYGRGDLQGWTTAAGTIPADGSYQFRFVSGSYDASNGRALGASLYLDNIRVTKSNPVITDTMVQEIAARVAYMSTAFSDPAPTNRVVTITAKNGNSETAEGTVNVMLNSPPANTAAVVTDAVYSVMNTSVLTGILNGTDADSNALTYKITTPASKGTVALSVYGAVYGGNTFTYTPNAGVTGSDTFVYVANDGTIDSNFATVTITLLPSDNADLTALTSSTGSLTPVFATNTTAYSATVPNGTSSMTVTGTVYDPNATVRVNGVVTASAAASAALPLNVGDNTITVEVTAQDGSTKKTYTLNIFRLRDNQPFVGGGGGSVTPTQPGVQIVVDGVVQEQSATAKNDKIGDQTATIITIDNEKVIAKLEKESNKVLTIPVTGNSDVVIGVLNGKLVKAMEGKDVTIEIKTDRGTYTLPASQINIDAISAQLGSNVKLEDIQISIKIGLSVQTTAEIIQKSAADGKITVVGAPITFEVTATLGGKTVDISQFNSYVERQIVLPDGTTTSQITTGVVLNADGTLTHVPTKISTIDGKTTATINSLTNSSYAVVLSPKSFADVETHWSKQDVNDMASRQVVQGVTDTTFQPDKAITRAEFIAIMVRALGLKSGMGSETPKDVQASDWYAGVVKTGVSYKLISGYEDGTFRPNLTITRKEAAAIIARALTIAKLNKGLTGEEVTKQLEFFTDGSTIPAWAKNDLAIAVKNNILQGADGKISADDNVTRAQSAAMLRRLLQQASLINK